ncbi:hypothetical protein [Flavobacterium sp. A45]|uniref:hypothetical protein n=1 Tax=Flavobacterium sp. A45 TaxID=1945862 RepID=UPI0009846605|nr:hypothetical protein [Flavobacterium sp. A45]OOG77341.1 hypothetical protein B0E44_02780 [Flavobacterium sp. A45]
MKDRIFYFVSFASTAMILFGCNDSDSNDGKDNSNHVPSIDATNLAKENHPMTMFEDDESPKKTYDNTDSWFRVNEPLQVILKGTDSVQISLYSPVGLKDVKIYAKLPTYDRRFIIYNFSHIPPFHRSVHQIPLTINKSQYEQEDGISVTINKIDGFKKEDIVFSIESEDSLFTKFKKIKSQRLVQFNDKYHIQEYGKFLPMNPVLAKEAITMIINYSYALSHPIYYETFTNFDRYKEEQAAVKGLPVTGAINLHGNQIDANGIYDYLTKVEIEESYKKYIDERIIEMAMTGKDTAWGGGKLVSHSERKYIEGHWKGDMSTWSHEYSHHCGYNHTSNFANREDGGGVQEMLANFYKYLIYINDLPFTDPDILKGYTKTAYLNRTYTKPVFKIEPDNPFLLKYKGEGKWK